MLVVVSHCCSFEMSGISVYAECEEKSPVEREEMTKLRMYNLEHKLWDQEGMVFLSSQQGLRRLSTRVSFL